MDVAFTVLYALVFAEIASGIFHWLEDRYGNPDWPVLGVYVIQPNIEHHRYPLRFTRGSWWTRNWTTFVPATLAALLVGVGCFLWAWPVWLALGLFILGFANESHCWTHVRCNRYIRFFQKLGIVQSGKHHGIHHHRPYNRNYCAFTNYMNPVLERLGFWLVLEWLVFFIFGVWPRPERELY